MLDGGSAVATWVEYAEGRSDFRLRLVDPSGERSAAITVTGVSGGRASGFPRVALSGDELIFAWSQGVDGSESGALQVQTAVARLPDALKISRDIKSVTALLVFNPCPESSLRTRAPS